MVMPSISSWLLLLLLLPSATLLSLLSLLSLSLYFVRSWLFDMGYSGKYQYGYVKIKSVR